jgi:hypothetical protein
MWFELAESKVQYHIELSNRFTGFENLTLRGILIELGKLFERISKFQPKRA